MENFDELRGCATGRPDLVNVWVNSVNSYEQKQKEWVKNLKQKGYKASHPNDGWVDRVNNKIKLAYPHFNDGLDVGDSLMLGSHTGYERPVKIIKIEEGTFRYFFFEDIKTKVINESK